MLEAERVSKKVKLIKEDKQKRDIKGQEEIKFSSTSAYHLIILTARARGEKQISNSATDDEDLTVKIDAKTFSSPATINGGRLHNLSKTVYFLTFLQGKDHELTLNTDNPPGTATFESLEIYTLDPADNLILEPKVQAEDGDRRSWMTFALDNIPLEDVSITVTYSRRKRDSDDVKVKIDSQTQENLLRNIKHFLWYFAGLLIPGVSPTKTQSQTFSTNFSSGLHYIEIDADRMPTLEKVESNRTAWYNCYDIAGKVIHGEVKDPTNGANHYYDDSIAAPYWATKETYVITIKRSDNKAALIFHKL